MAENFIKHEDLIEQGDPFVLANAGIQTMIDNLEKLSATLKTEILPLWEQLNSANAASAEGQAKIIKIEQEYGKLEAQIKDVNNALLQLNETKKKAQKGEQEYNVVIARSRQEEKNRRREIELTGKVNAEHTGSLARMRAELNLLNFQASKTTAAYKNLKPEIIKLTTEIKKQEAALGDHRRNVGNYPKLMGALGDAFNQASGRVGAFASSIGLAGGAASAFIGVAAGLAAPFIAFFKLTEEGSEMLERKLAGLKSSFGVLGGDIAKVGEFIVGDDKGPIQWGNIFTKVGQALLTTANIIPGVRDYFGGLRDRMNEAGAAAEEFTRKMQDLEEQEYDINVQRAEQNKNLAKAKLDFNDETLSLNDRAKALGEVLRIEKDILDQELAFEKQKEDALKQRYIDLELNNQTAEAERIRFEYKKQHAAVLRIEEESYIRSRKATTQYNNALEELSKTEKDRIKTNNTEEEKRRKENVDTIVKARTEEFKRIKDAEDIARNERIEDEKFMNDAIEELEKEAADSSVQIEKDRVDEINEELDRELAKRQLIEQGKAEIAAASFDTARSFLDLQMANIDAAYEAEIKAAGDNQVKKDAIEKEYAAKRQKVQIAQAIMNAAQGITEVWAKYAAYPPIAIALSALSAANTAIQIATIKKQKFAEGGSGLISDEGGILSGRSHAEGGVNLGSIGEAERGEYFGIINKGMTNKYKGILPEVFDSLNNGNFENVWGNALKQIQPVVIQESNEKLLKQINENLIKFASGRAVVLPDGRVFVKEGNNIAIYRA